MHKSNDAALFLSDVSTDGNLSKTKVGKVAGFWKLQNFDEDVWLHEMCLMYHSRKLNEFIYTERRLIGPQ